MLQQVRRMCGGCTLSGQLAGAPPRRCGSPTCQACADAVEGVDVVWLQPDDLTVQAQRLLWWLRGGTR